MFNWPNDLVSDIARRTCVLYIGAGVSANSSSAKGISPPTWEAFLRSCLTKINKADCAYIEQLLSQKDLLSACEVIIDKIGTAEFNNVAQDAFRRPGFKPASIHETIYNLDARLVITPNVDKIYEQYAQATSCGTIVVKKQTEHDISNFIRSTDRVILKAHGSIDAPNEMIFSKYQYNEARYKYSGFYERVLTRPSLVVYSSWKVSECALINCESEVRMKAMLSNAISFRTSSKSTLSPAFFAMAKYK